MGRPEKKIIYPDHTAHAEAIKAFDWATTEREKALKDMRVNNPHRHTIEVHWNKTIKHFKERMRLTKPKA